MNEIILLIACEECCYYFGPMEHNSLLERLGS
jgi:hypothetical protein